MLDVGIRFGAIKGVVFYLKMMKTGPDSGENLMVGLCILWPIPWWCSSRLRTRKGSITRIDTIQTGKTFLLVNGCKSEIPNNKSRIPGTTLYSFHGEISFQISRPLGVKPIWWDYGCQAHKCPQPKRVWKGCIS